MKRPEQFVYWFLGASMNQLGNTSKYQRAQLCEQVKKLVDSEVDTLLIAYMINGFYEIQDGKHFDELDKQVVEHLKLFFNKVTPEVKVESKPEIKINQLNLRELYEEAENWSKKYPNLGIHEVIC